MKIKHIFFTLFAAAAMLAGCEKPVDFGEPSLTISTYTASVPLGGGSVTVKVNSTRDWVVRTDADWVIVDPESGVASFDDVTVTITAPANAGVNRSAEIEFYGGKLACESLMLTQEGPEGDPDAIKTVTCAQFASMPDDDGKIYRLEGTISGSINTQFGNYDVVDETGSVYVYGSTNVDEFVDMLKKGNKIVVEGPKTTYNGKPEMKNCTIISIEKGEGGGTPSGDHSKSVYYNDFDKEAAEKTYGSNKSSWPYLDQFDGWKNQVGTGAAGVTYDFNGMSVRNNSNSDANYSDYPGSGTNNIFFGTKAYFIVKDIALASGSNYTLTFGTEKYINSDSDNTFKHNEFHVYVSNDGAKWVELSYTFPNGDKSGRWDIASSTFTLPAGTSKLYLYFASDLTSSHRVDDVELVTATAAGTAIDFSKGVDLNGGTGGGDTPGGDENVQTVTCAEFIQKADPNTTYRLVGEVVSDVDTQYCSFDMNDGTAKVVVWTVNNKDEWKNVVKKGGKVTVRGKYKLYTAANGSTKDEMVDAYIEAFEPGQGGDTPGGDTPGGDTPAEITDATVAQFLAAEESTTKYYRLKGVVSEIKSTEYGNFTITDDSGSVYVYGLTSTMKAYNTETGKWPNDKSFSSLGIKAGDTVTLVGTRGSYGETIEVCGAYCEKVVPGEGGGDIPGDEVQHGATTVAAFNAAAVSTSDWYQLTGKISGLAANDSYGNFNLTDETGSVYVYGVLSEKGGEKQKFQDLVQKYGIANGGTITVNATRGEYNGTIETVNAYFVGYVAGEQEEEIKGLTLTFPDDNKDNNPVSAYTETWTAKKGSASWTITNFNNNKWGNNWTYIKCGRKNNDSVASIATATPVASKVTKVVVAIDKCTAGNVNSTKMIVAKDASFTDVVETVDVKIAVGDLEYKVSAPAEGLYYKLVYDCSSASANGVIQISKIIYAE